MKHAREVVTKDLAYICSCLEDDFVRLGGSRVLMTGGAGFLGYYMVQALLFWNDQHPDQPPIEVTVFDNFGRGRPAWMERIIDRDDCHIKQHDIVLPLPADGGNFQHIIHAASIASPLYYRRHPIQTMDANVMGLRHLLDYAVARKQTADPVRSFLFFSTSEIYGDPSPENIPTPEHYRGNVSCTGPRACYDESKRFGETMCVNFAKEYALPIKIVRPFNNYGPGLKITDKRALPDFARNIFAGEDIVLLSDGSPTRTFCYVADAVVGFFKTLLRGRDGEAYNIGMDQPEISIRQLAEKVISCARELYGYQGSLVFARSDDPEYLTDNPNRRCPVLAKAREELGYAPAISLEEGIRRSLIWYRDNQEVEEEA